MHLVCGEALYDVFVEPESRADDGRITLQAVAGGSPFNVAIGLARLGVRVALATDLAQDSLGMRLADRLAKEGVCDRLLRRSATATALAFVTLGSEGTPSYEFRGLHDATFAPEDAAVAAQHSEITNLHIGSIALILPRSSDRLLALARRLKSEALISLDPNVRLTIEPDPVRWRQAIETVRPLAHVVKVSEEDLASLYGDGVDCEHVCVRWLSDETELVVLTRGNGGAKIFTRANAPLLVPAIPVPVVDTVGAGDSFMAALLARLSQKGRLTTAAIATQTTRELEDLGEYAALAAALTCSRRGPALPSSVEMQMHAANGRVVAAAPGGR
jgi:fructokinase